MNTLNTKLVTLGSVFVLSAIVYWGLFNHYVLQNTRSQAAGGNVTVSFHETAVTVANPVTDPVEVNVFFNSKALLGSSTISFRYSPELRFDSPVPGRDVISALCRANGFAFTQLLAVNFDDNFGGGNISRSVDPSSDLSSSGLPSGYFCETTLTFKFKTNKIDALPVGAQIWLWDPTDPQCSIGPTPIVGGTNRLCYWEIVGPDASGQPIFYNPVLDPNKSLVKVVADKIGFILTPTPPPFDIVTPTPTPADDIVIPTLVQTPFPTVTPKPFPTITPFPLPTATPLPFSTAVPTQTIPTVTPVLPTTPISVTSTPAPTDAICPRYQQGDFSCDNLVNLIDFNQWLSCYTTYLKTGKSDPYFDLNEDGKCSLYEFEVIRSNFDFN